MTTAKRGASVFADYCPVCLIRMAVENWPAWGRPVICDQHARELEAQSAHAGEYYRQCQAWRAIGERRQLKARMTWETQMIRWQATAQLDQRREGGEASE